MTHVPFSESAGHGGDDAQTAPDRSGSETRPFSSHFDPEATAVSAPAGPGISAGRFAVRRRFLFFCAWFLVYALCIFSLFAGTAIDSDFSNMVLEAADIVSGNVFLEGWTQTGISFLTTDLLYFIFGVLIAGVSPMSFVIAVSAMFLVYTAFARLLMRTPAQGLTVRKELLFLAIAGIPCAFSLVALRSHVGGMIWVMAGILLAEEIYKPGPQSKKVLLFALFIFVLAMACIGDASYFIIGIATFLIYGLFRLFDSSPDRPTHFRLMVSAGIAAGLSVLFNRLYYEIGGAVRNNYLTGYLSFGSLSDIFDNFLLYTAILFKMNDAGFMGEKAASPETLFLFLHAVVVLAALWIVFDNLAGFLKGTNKDMAGILLSLGFVLISAVLILTNIMLDEKAGRYFSFVPVVFAVLIIRYIDRLIPRPEKTAGRSEKSENNPLSALFSNPLPSRSAMAGRLFSRRHELALVLLSLVLIAGNMTAFSFGLEPVETDQSRLAGFLESRGLGNGYGHFWDASIVSVSSGNNVTIRAVSGKGSSFSKYDWFCKGEWYQEPAHFIVISDPGRSNYKEENVVAAFGQPSQLLEFEKYRIYVYDRDLSKELTG